MKYLYIWLAGLFLLACTVQETEKPRDIRLWYDAPAANWNEALPLGNGRLGAMVFGDPQKEHLQLNENTLYSGEPSTTFTDVRIPHQRELVLSDAINRTTYQVGDVRYEREVFASHPDDLIIIHVKSDKADGIDVSLNLSSVHPTAKGLEEEGKLVLKGQAPGYVERRTFEQMESWGDQYKHPELYDSDGKRKFNKRVSFQ